MAEFYVNENYIYNAYIGDVTYTLGANPFAVVTPDVEKNTDTILWSIVLAVLSLILFGGIGYALFKWRSAMTSVNNI